MAFTLVGYSESQVSASVFVAVAAIPDQHVRVDGDNVVIPELTTVIGGWGQGATLIRTRLSSPSLRSFIQPEINPIVNAAAYTETDLLRFQANYNLPLVMDEQLQVEIQATAALAEADRVFIMLADTPTSPVEGEIFTIRATHGAITALVWSNIALTLEQTLPVGSYQIVGARHESATALAFRFVMVGGVWRPGGPSSIAVGNVDPPGSRRGGWGVWAEFDQLRPPTVDVFATAADASGVVYIDLIRV